VINRTSWTISRYYPVIRAGMKTALKTKSRGARPPDQDSKFQIPILPEQNRIVNGFDLFRFRCTLVFLTRPMCPLNCCPSQESPVPLKKYHNGPRLRLLTSQRSKKNEPKLVRLRVAKAGLSHKT